MSFCSYIKMNQHLSRISDIFTFDKFVIFYSLMELHDENLLELEYCLTFKSVKQNLYLQNSHFKSALTINIFPSYY